MPTTSTPPSTIRLPEQRHSESLPAVPADVPVDVDALICPECAEPLRAAPPVYWLVADGLPAPVFSHAADGTALCRTRSGIVAEPVEARWWPLEVAR